MQSVFLFNQISFDFFINTEEYRRRSGNNFLLLLAYQNYNIMSVRLKLNRLLTVLFFLFTGYSSIANNGYYPADTTKPGILSVQAKDSLLSDNEDSLKIFEKVEIEASFPGGDNAWRKYIEQNVNSATPAEYGAPAGAYTVVVQFVVDKNGNISDVRPLTRHGFGMEAEVVRVIKRGPRWIPAMQDGRNVKAYRKQPVTFSVTVEKRKRKNKD